MSHSQPEFDIWAFISCARCHLSFFPGPGIPPQVPFWVTECGHIVCNNHLKADQSCAQCHAHGIEVFPLQSEMDTPMSSWFCSIPHAADNLAAATKFQQETMASLVRFYKKKCDEGNTIIDRLKGDAAGNKMLKKEIQSLRSEIDQLRQRLGFASGNGDAGLPNARNVNGKRPRTSANRSSSPHSGLAPIGSNRLTLPANQPPPDFSSRPDAGEMEAPRPNDFEQYAYAPPQTPQIHRQGLSHAQAAPIRQSQRWPLSESRSQMSMPPPAVPSSSASAQSRGPSFKPALMPTANSLNRAQITSAILAQETQPGAPVNRLASRDRRAMGPPPTPQPHSNSHSQAPGLAHFTPTLQRFPPTPQSNRFVPSTSGGLHFVPQALSSAPQRFTTASGNNSTGSSRISKGGQSQRMPFVPGGGR